MYRTDYGKERLETNKVALAVRHGVMKARNRMVTGKNRREEMDGKEIRKGPLVLSQNSSYFKTQIFPTVYHIYES